MTPRRILKRALMLVGVEASVGPSAILVRRIGLRRMPAMELASASDLKLNLGAGGKPVAGWVNVDIQARPGIDLVSEATHLPMLPDGCARAIQLDAVYEHLYRWERPEALAEWRRLLQPGGTLTIRWIPDFDVILDLYRTSSPGITGPTFDLECVYRYTHGEPTRFNAPFQLHKDVFTKESVRSEIEAAGFGIVSLTNERFEDEAYALNVAVHAIRK
jgi:predicted SAM-dependent methyltransferase